MKSSTQVYAVFYCPVETAFKTPILGDARKIHTGSGLMPLVTHFEDDKTWGKENGSRKVFVAKNLMFKEGEWALDTVTKRTENEYWSWELTHFKQGGFGFKKFKGEWFVEDLKNGTVGITYVYSLFSSNFLIYPFHWMFTKTIWKKYMRHALENIQQLAENKPHYMYE